MSSHLPIYQGGWLYSLALGGVVCVHWGQSHLLFFAAACCTHTAPMTLPAKLQASILSWVGESSEPRSEPVVAAPAAVAAATATGREEKSGSNSYYPLLTPADLFSLSSQGVAAGSPGVVVKDGFLGREQALRSYEGETCFLLLVSCKVCAFHYCCTPTFVYTPEYVLLLLNVV